MIHSPGGLFFCGYGGNMTSKFRRWFVPGFGALALITLAGCSGSSGSYATVSGVVTLNGAPVDGAKVVLHSTVESGGKAAGSYAAQTDSSGKYLIAQIGKEPGIPPGMYKVTVIK